jgi:hypothetical protein
MNFFNNNMMYIKIDLFFIFPLAMINLSEISIVNIKLIARPLCITHLVKYGYEMLKLNI